MTFPAPLPMEFGAPQTTRNASGLRGQDYDVEAALPRKNALNTCSKATACAGHLAMLYFGTVLQKHITAKALGPEAEQVPTGVIVATGAFAVLLALPSFVGLIKSFAQRDSA